MNRPLDMGFFDIFVAHLGGKAHSLVMLDAPAKARASHRSKCGKQIPSLRYGMTNKMLLTNKRPRW